MECRAADAERVGEMMRAEMEGVCPDLPIKLKVDVGVGTHWDEV